MYMYMYQYMYIVSVFVYFWMQLPAFTSVRYYYLLLENGCYILVKTTGPIKMKVYSNVDHSAMLFFQNLKIVHRLSVGPRNFHFFFWEGERLDGYTDRDKILQCEYT